VKSIKTESIMSIRRRRGDGLCFRRLLGIALASVGVIALGCDSRPSTAQRLANAYKESGIKPVPLYPLAGKVTVDNEAPSPKANRSLLVVAYDASRPDSRAADHKFVQAQTDGSFEFPGGLPAGKYLMVFAELIYRRRGGFLGADGLNNLYNDPDVNSKKPQFVIDHQAPGKTDYEFNLTVAGETPPAASGPKALVSQQEARRASTRK
jgi:hypothetical protein